MKISPKESCLKSLNDLLLIRGFVYDLHENRELTLKEIRQLCKKSLVEKKVVSERYTGQYSIIFITEKNILIFNDFVGIGQVFYKLSENNIIVTDSEKELINLDLRLDYTGICQSLVPPLNISFFRRSNFDGINRMLSGEYVLYDRETTKRLCLCDAQEMVNKRIKRRDKEKIIKDLVENSRIYQERYKKVILPISGGVDSRITLESLIPNLDSKKTKTLSYGNHDYIDNIIANKVSKKIGLQHQNIPFATQLFPSLSEVEKLINNGGEFYINSWFSVIKQLGKQGDLGNGSVVLIGDVLDLLRAKNIKSMRSRKKRIRVALRAFFSKKREMNPIDLKLFIEEQMKTFSSRLDSILKEDPDLLERFGLNRSGFEKQTLSDLSNYISYVFEKVSPKFQENLEEGFFLFTWGSRTMAKQVNVFQGAADAYVLMASRHLVKAIIRYHPFDRFEDKLTHDLLRMQNFDCLSGLETSQIPFLSYRRNIYAKYLGWMFRSMADQVLIKLKGKGLVRRGRLFKHIEWPDYYREVRNEKQLYKLLQDSPIKRAPLSIFNRRKVGESWPLSEVDINAFVHPSYLLIKKREFDES